MRSRNIKPAFFLNDKLAECDYASRLLFIGLWCYADREGKFEWIPKRIKAAIFPYDESIDVEKCLCNLMSLHFITCHNNVGYIEKFIKHQNPHPHESKSILPDKPSHNMPSHKVAVTVDTNVMTRQDNVMTCNADIIIPDIRNPDIRKEDIIKDDSLNRLSALACLWNETCIKLPSVKQLSSERKKRERLRLKERNIESWKQIFEKINGSMFCTGNNDKKWVATYDWIIKNEDNSIKVLEGKYDDRGKSSNVVPEVSEKNKAMWESMKAEKEKQKKEIIDIKTDFNKLFNGGK